MLNNLQKMHLNLLQNINSKDSKSNWCLIVNKTADKITRFAWKGAPETVLKTDKKNKRDTKVNEYHQKVDINPSGTQRPEDVPLWSYFGRDVLDHNRTKIGCIRFLTYFGSAMSDLHLASEKFP